MRLKCARHVPLHCVYLSSPVQRSWSCRRRYEFLLVVVLCISSLRHSGVEDFVGGLLLLKAPFHVDEGVHLANVVNEARDTDVDLVRQFGLCILCLSSRGGRCVVLVPVGFVGRFVLPIAWPVA